MKAYRSWFLAAGAVVGLISTGFSGAGAHSSQRPSHTVPARSGSPSAAPSRSHDGRFFGGHGGGTPRPFHLAGGKYVINVLVNFNSAYDTGSGQCLFTAYLNGVEQPAFLSLGTAVPVLGSAPYVAKIPVTATAGHYKLIVSPTTTCDWSVVILSSGKTAPGIEVLAARSFLVVGTNVTPGSLVHMGQTLLFQVFVRLVGGLKGQPAGTFTMQEHGAKPQTAALFVAKDAYGIKKMYVDAKFTQNSGDRVGPATITFTISAGGHHVSKKLRFTVAP